MKTRTFILGLICLCFILSCNEEIKNPYSPPIVQPFDETQGEHNPSKTAIKIVDEPELFFICHDYESSFETFDFLLTIKNVSDKLIIGCVLKLIIYGEDSQGEWDYLVYHQWDMLTGAGMMPSDIFPGEERIVTTIGWHSIPIGTAGGIDMCERMKDGNAEFKFEAYF